MHLTLTDSFLTKLQTLRADYENRTKLNLESSPHPYKVSLFFGKKDVKTRFKQITFIENWLTLLKPKLKPDLNFNSTEEFQEHLLALRVLATITFFVRNQIDETYTIRSGSNATLMQLLDEALSLNRTNVVDEESYVSCLSTTQTFISNMPLAKVNHLLLAATTNAKNAYINELEWNKFTQFVNKQFISHTDPVQNKYKDYPITAITVPLFALPLRATGTSVGWLLGDLTSKSYSLLPMRQSFTAIFASGLVLFLGPTSSMGIMLVAPTYAGKLLDTFFGVSFAYLLGSAMGLLGKGLGWSIGMSLDLSWKLLGSACSLIAVAYSGKAHELLTGFTLTNGHRVLNGMELQFMDLPEFEKIIAANYEPKPIIINHTKEGFAIKIGDEETKIKWITASEPNLPHLQELITKLKEKQTVRIEELPNEKEQILKENNVETALTPSM
ncbi:Dot/Icm secretion system substrate [Legionella busanensis]|uniref:Dot/Icm secretion system substrate n=1 Tax=Legionella busanensis TaxID=190655 RepID=A0A378JM59_9GAMM|nr:hypothetical protein [Legionella busanensis]STX51160.1 Dot/Icm secretion system substrate [Legionella busanensis]